MTDILTSFWGRKKPKPVAPERPASQQVAAAAAAAAADEFVVVNSPANRAHTSMYPTSQSNNEYESLFSYLRVTDAQNGSSNAAAGMQPMRPAPPAPSSSSSSSSSNALPYPLHGVGPQYGHMDSASAFASSSAAAAGNEQSSSAYYLTGVPFQFSRSLADPALVNRLCRDSSIIKSPIMSDYEYSFSVEMEVIRELSPTNMSPVP